MYLKTVNVTYSLFKRDDWTRLRPLASALNRRVLGICRDETFNRAKGVPKYPRSHFPLYFLPFIFYPFFFRTIHFASYRIFVFFLICHVTLFQWIFPYLACSSGRDGAIFSPEPKRPPWFTTWAWNGSMFNSRWARISSQECLYSEIEHTPYRKSHPWHGSRKSTWRKNWVHMDHLTQVQEALRPSSTHCEEHRPDWHDQAF